MIGSLHKNRVEYRSVIGSVRDRKVVGQRKDNGRDVEK